VTFADEGVLGAGTTENGGGKGVQARALRREIFTDMAGQKLKGKRN